MDNNSGDFTDIIRRLPNYTKLLYELYSSKNVPVKQKGVLSVGIAYNLSPVDLIPGVIPVAGQLDNVIVTLWSIKKVLYSLDAPVREAHLDKVGLTMEIIEEDSANARQALQDIGKGAVRLTANGAKIVGYSAKNAYVKLSRKKPY